MDLSERGLGMRSKRYAMIVEDGVVKALEIEDAPGSAEKSGAEAIAKLLD
jgi:peroxiredoxin